MPDALEGAVTPMFASRSVSGHLVRGVIGLGALTGAVVFASALWPALLLLPVALVALRGCPMCWTVGLVETIVAGVRGRAAPAACVDGSCRLTPPLAR